MPHSKTDYIDYEQPTPLILKHTKKINDHFTVQIA